MSQRVDEEGYVTPLKSGKIRKQRAIGYCQTMMTHGYKEFLSPFARKDLLYLAHLT